MSEQDSRARGGWADHERAQRRRMATLPLAEKLRWLEEADDLVRHLRQARGSRGGKRPGDRARDASD